MPTKAPRRCTTPGCPHPPPCTRHTRPRKAGHWKGYTPDWPKISAAYRATRPVCEHPNCNRPSRHVDHNDGNKTNNERWNLRAYCIPCHSRKTATHDGGYGTRRRLR